VILVDTSVLIGFLTGADTPGTRYLERLEEQAVPFHLSSVVIQETLQGARDIGQWRKLESYLTNQLCVEPQQGLKSYVEAARIYFDCRRKALTVRSTTDCLIAQIALEHGYALLHEDRDFDAIARVRPLRTLP
jgi:predicted nucleic acid-binding protein